MGAPCVGYHTILKHNLRKSRLCRYSENNNKLYTSIITLLLYNNFDLENQLNHPTNASDSAPARAVHNIIGTLPNLFPTLDR